MTSNYLLEFYSVDKKSIYSNYIVIILEFINININININGIFLFMLMNNLKEPYHQNILNLHKQLSPNNYSDSLNNLITKNKKKF